jgi:iron-sulfur cluster assembly accessory protein
MITLTEKAITAVGRFIADSKKPTAGLRIEVTDGGCSGYQYGLKLESSHTAEDTIIDCGTVKVIIDPISMPMLDGMSIDFLDSLDGSGFKFTNPNAVKSCACGTSFSTSDNGEATKTCSTH